MCSDDIYHLTFSCARCFISNNAYTRTSLPGQVVASFMELGDYWEEGIKGWEIGVETSLQFGKCIHLCFFSLSCSTYYRYQAPRSRGKKRPLLFIPTRLRSLYFFPILLLKRPHWHFIQSQQCLVGIFHQHVLAIFHIPTHIDNGPDDAPAVSEIEIHLLGELARIVADDAEDDMSVGDFGGSSGYETVIKRLGDCEKEGRWVLAMLTQFSSRLHQPV